MADTKETRLSSDDSSESKADQAVPNRDMVVAHVSKLIAEDARTGGGDDYQLRRMAQALRNYNGRFGLLFAVCNVAREQKRLSRTLIEVAPDLAPVELQLSGNEASLLDTLLKAPHAPRPLIVYGIESLFPTEVARTFEQQEILQELQLRREQFHQLGRPLLLWMPEYVYTLIGQQAIDFWSWQSGGFFFGGHASIASDVEPDLSKSIPRFSAVLYSRFSDRTFVGRESQAEAVKAALRRGHSLVIAGAGGVGKTELAIHMAKALQAEYPDGQLFISLQSTREKPRSVLEGLQEIIRTYHPEVQLSHDITTLSAIYRSTLSGKKTLIILDDVSAEDYVRPFIPPSGSALLVTSRRKLDLPNFTNISLDQLSYEEARFLLQSLAHNVTDEEADEICELCGYLPLAIHLAGSFLSSYRTVSPRDYIEQLRECLRAHTEVQSSSLLEHSVKSALDLTAKHLDKKALNVFYRLSVFPESFDARAESQICRDLNNNALKKLKRFGLIKYSDAVDRYRLPSRTRTYALSHLDDLHYQRTSKRHAKYYLATAKRAADLYLRGNGFITKGLRLFDLEWENIGAGQGWAASHAGADKEAAHLCSRYPMFAGELLELRRPPRDQISWFEAGLNAAQKAGDQPATSHLLNKIGRTYASIGEPHRAIKKHEEALEIARQEDEQKLLTDILGNLGWAHEALGDYRKAIEYYEQQLSNAQRANNRRNEGVALGHLGRAYAALGRHHHAIEYQEQALSISREIGNRRAEGAALGNIGRAYAAIGEPRLAINYHQQALEIAREIGDLRGEGNVLGNLGWAYATIGQIHRAVDFYERSLIIARQMGNRRAEAAALDNLGRAFGALGEHRRSIDCHEQSLSIDRAIDDPRGEGTSLGSLGEAYASLGEYHHAIELFERSLKIARQINNRRAEGGAMGNLGRVYTALGQYGKALEFFEASLKTAREVRNRRAEAYALRGMASVLSEVGEKNKAIDCAQEAVAILEKIEDPSVDSLRQQLKLWTTS